jgi:hypothetical protein
MSYPPPQHYTPPYGQPHLPQRRNLWLIGATVIAVLLILMTVTLILVMQAKDEDRAGGSGSGGGETTQETTSEAEETEEEPPPSEEPSRSNGGGDSPSGTVFAEETCDLFDVSEFEEHFGSEADPDDSYAYAWEGSGNGTGSVSCSFYIGWDSVSIAVSVYADAAGAKQWHESDREYWDGETKYDVADYKEFGDEGFYYTFGSTDHKKVLISGIVGNIAYEADTWIDLSELDVEEALAMLQRLIDQAHELFGEYETN